MKSPLKLLFVLPNYEPAWVFGGVVRCMSSLCRGLAELGHEVTVYTINTDGHGHELALPGGSPVSLGGVSTHFFPSTLGPHSVFDSRALVRHLRQTAGNFDLIYVSAIWQLLGVYVSSICAKARVPLVIGTHGSFNKTNRKRGQAKKWLYWQLLLKKTLARASALHLTTKDERRESGDLLVNFKSFIVPNGLDCNYFRPLRQYRDNFRQRFNIPFDAPMIITIGRADPAKRFDLLINALSLVPEFYLLIVGPEEGALTKKWKKLAEELQVAERVIWPGHLAGEELLTAYGAADIFSLISNAENFAMVVIEAMACGLPGFINFEVGVSEALKEAEGMVVVDKHPSAITAVLKEFLRQRDRWNAWGESNLNKAHELFSKERVAALMAEAFADVLNGTITTACNWYIPGQPDC